jgi:hypothetical protein
MPLQRLAFSKSKRSSHQSSLYSGLRAPNSPMMLSMQTGSRNISTTPLCPELPTPPPYRLLQPKAFVSLSSRGISRQRSAYWALPVITRICCLRRDHCLMNVIQNCNTCDITSCVGGKACATLKGLLSGDGEPRRPPPCPASEGAQGNQEKDSE